MPFNGYNSFVHAVMIKKYGVEMARLTSAQFELWWRSFSDEERQQEFRSAIGAW